MKSISMSGSLRKSVGKKDAKEVRKQGMVPCVIYGKGENITFLLNEAELLKAIFTPETYVINIDIEGKKRVAILQEVQYHPVSDKVLHADFYELHEDVPFVANIPVKYTGTSKGVLRGGTLTKKFRKIHLKGLMKDIPDVINIDISGVDVLSPYRISDIVIPNVKVMEGEREIVASVAASRSMAEEEGGTEETAPAENKE